MKGSQFTNFVMDQLAELEGLICKRMFGGWGFYCSETFFAIISGETLYFKTDEISRADFEKLGMEPFRPSPRQTLKTYYEVPGEILEDRVELLAWARRAIAAQKGE
jgi:DNA transformation protein